MVKINRITSLVVTSVMLGGVGSSTTTALASTVDSTTNDAQTRTVQVEKDIGSAEGTSMGPNEMLGASKASLRLPGYLGEFEEIITGFEMSYSGGIKCGKWTKKNHPKINKEVRSHIGVANAFLGIGFRPFLNGYMKGSK